MTLKDRINDVVSTGLFGKMFPFLPNSINSSIQLNVYIRVMNSTSFAMSLLERTKICTNNKLEDYVFRPKY
jgi:hypothetical protein